MVNRCLGHRGFRHSGAEIRGEQGTAIEGGPEMPSILTEALEWLDRAEQAREVAGQLTDPGARKAVLELAERLEPP